MTFNYKELIWRSHHHRFGLAGEGQADRIAEYLREQPGLVLNIGCGPDATFVANLSRECLRLVAADRATKFVIEAAANAPTVAFIAADAYSLPFSQSTFEHVVGFGVLAHIHQPVGFFSELARVLRLGGKAMLTTSVAHAEEPVLAAARTACLDLLENMLGYCPVASGTEPRRRLLVFRRM